MRTRIDEECQAGTRACVEAKVKEMRGDPAAPEFYLLAKQHFQRVEREFLFDVACSVADGILAPQIDQEVHAACRAARLKEMRGDPTAAQSWSSARLLERVGREQEFDGICRSVDEQIDPNRAHPPQIRYVTRR
jgi:hypothetical protein